MGSHLKPGKVKRHPFLGVPICKQCFKFYYKGEWTKGEDGSYNFCCWCAQGGDIFLCDKCPNAFCKKCIKRNLGRRKVTEIENKDEWTCIPKQIYKQRAIYYSIYHYFQTAGDREQEERLKKEELQKLVFIEQSFKAAFECNEWLNTCLKNHQSKWDKKKSWHTDEDVKKVVIKQRTMFAMMKHNMRLLEEDLLRKLHDTLPHISFDDVKPEIDVKIEPSTHDESMKSSKSCDDNKIIQSVKSKSKSDQNLSSIKVEKENSDHIVICKEELIIENEESNAKDDTNQEVESDKDNMEQVDSDQQQTTKVNDHVRNKDSDGSDVEAPSKHSRKKDDGHTSDEDIVSKSFNVEAQIHAMQSDDNNQAPSREPDEGDNHDES